MKLEDGTSPAPGREQEARWERSKRRGGLVAGPALFLLIVAAPVPLSPAAHTLLAVFAWTVVYWATEALPLPVTALLSSVLAIALGLAPARTVLAAYADPVIFLFLGSFVLAEAMRGSALDRRFAYFLLAREWAAGTPARLLLTMGAVTCGLSLWLSNTATTAIMLPVGLGLLRAMGPAGQPGAGRFPIGLLLMLTWGSSVAVGVPVGSPPNLIAIGMIRDLAGRRLTFVDWMAVTLPLTVAMLLLCWLLLVRLYPAGGADVLRARAHLGGERERLGPWTRRQATVLAVFVLAVGLWTAPGLVAAVTSPEAPLARLLEERIPESAVALLAAVLLFVLPTSWRRGEFAIDWRQAATIDWGTILLFGGGLALGRLLFDTGLAAALGGGVIRLTGAESVWTLTAAAIVLGIGLSEIASNTASASIIVPVVIAVAQEGGVSPVPPALGAALGASFGFMLPVSTPPNAIVYGSGLVPLSAMIRSGFWLDVSGGLLIWAGLRLLCPLVGLL